MLKNKTNNQLYLWLLCYSLDIKQHFFNKSQYISCKVHINFIKFSVKYNKNLNKSLDLRYGIDRIEQNECIIGDYNKKVILPSFLRNLEFSCSELSNKIFHHASFTHAWFEDFTSFLNWESLCCYCMTALYQSVAARNFLDLWAEVYLV